MPRSNGAKNVPGAKIACSSLFTIGVGWGVQRGGGEEELPAIGASPVPADSRERVPTPRVSTTRIGMQEHRLD